jgi:hypothetical protein
MTSLTRQLLLNRQAENRHAFTFDNKAPSQDQSGKFLGLSGNNATLELANGETILARLTSNGYLKAGQSLPIKYSGGQAWVSGMSQG